MKFPESVSTFHQFKKFFWFSVVQFSANIATIHAAFDVYLQNSLKESARKKQVVSTAINFESTTGLPKKMQKFLHNSSNKTKLFSYLAEKDDCLLFDDKDRYNCKKATSNNLLQSFIFRVWFFTSQVFISIRPRGGRHENDPSLLKTKIKEQ